MKYAMLLLLVMGFCYEVVAFDAPLNCPAKPAKKNSARDLASTFFEKGQNHVRAKEYQEAVQAYLCSLKMVEHPSTLVNAGNAALLAGQYDLAIELGQSILANDKSDVRTQKDAKTLLAAAKKARDKSESKRDSPETIGHSSKERTNGDGDTRAEHENTGGAGSDKATPGWKKTRMEIGGWTTLGVGVALLIGGGITGGLALSKNSEVEKACQNRVCYEDDYKLLNTRNNLATTSTVLLITGGVIAATGIVLLLAGKRTESKNTAVSWGFAPQGVIVRGAF